MSKELFIAAHEQLIEEYLEAHPDATAAEAYERTSDSIHDRYADNFGGMIDAARMRAKDASLGSPVAKSQSNEEAVVS